MTVNANSTVNVIDMVLRPNMPTLPFKPIKPISIDLGTWIRDPYYPCEPIQGPQPDPQPEPKEPLHIEDVGNPFIPPEIDYFGFIGTAIGKVVDKLLLKDKGESSIVNPSTFEISTIGGTKEAPGRIVMSDDSTGKTNTYVYRKVTPEEIAKGQLETGEKISKDQFKEGKTYYVLVSAENGKASIKSNHVEIYALNYSEENGTPSYVLEQDEGMDGAGKSSINLEA